MHTLKVVNIDVDCPVTAIGDIHGQYQTLLMLMERIPKNHAIIFLGDIIDGANQSKEAMHYIFELLENRPHTYLTSANHESHLIGAFHRSKVHKPFLQKWFLEGHGFSCLQSYGWQPQATYADVKEMDLSAERIQNLVSAHIEANDIRRLIDYACEAFLVNDQYFFVHGSLLPEKDISEHTLMETYQPKSRMKFLKHKEEPFRYNGQEVLVIHGHSPIGFYPYDAMDPGKNFLYNTKRQLIRINTDTGASCGPTGHHFNTGYLTAATIHPDGHVEQLSLKAVGTPCRPHPNWHA